MTAGPGGPEPHAPLGQWPQAQGPDGAPPNPAYPPYAPSHAPNPYAPAPYAPMPKPPALPVEERTYAEFLRTPANAWWRSLVALLMMGAIFGVVSLLQAIPLFVDLASGRASMEDLQAGKITMSPVLLAVTAVSLALLIPGAMLTQKVTFGQQARWLHSVEGRFRWGWALRCLAVMLPIWLLWLGIPTLLDTTPKGDTSQAAAYIAIALLLIPFQSAGEEYMFRGLINRSVAAWLPEKFGLVAGALVSSGLFTLVHGAGDLWLNFYYFSLGLVFCALTWRTGGLEASSVLHAVNNVLAFTAAALTGHMSEGFDRSAGQGSPVILISLLAGLVVLGLVELWHRRGPWLRVAAPGRELIAGQPTLR
ncbi:lysostaphin resistance A-like protein [Mariniluteicoccus flavus]